MDRIAVVTGAGRGIGLAISRRLVSDGWTVAGCDMLETELAAAAGVLGGSFHPYVVDVTDEDGVNTTCERILSGLGPVQGLVNNAGITRDNLLMRMDALSWEKVLKVNLTGAFLVTRALSKGMMRQKQGSIVNISSVVGLMGSAGQSNYSASKAGLIGLTKSLAREFAPRGIRVNAVAPGFIETDMTRDLSEEVRTSYAARIPLARMGRPEDIAEAVSFLLGDSSAYITGIVLPVDGGLST
jgi:3-oxoacyl-[acyl-carrier protein] reductase